MADSSSFFSSAFSSAKNLIPFSKTDKPVDVDAEADAKEAKDSAIQEAVQQATAAIQDAFADAVDNVKEKVEQLAHGQPSEQEEQDVAGEEKIEAVHVAVDGGDAAHEASEPVQEDVKEAQVVVKGVLADGTQIVEGVSEHAEHHDAPVEEIKEAAHEEEHKEEEVVAPEGARIVFKGVLADGTQIVEAVSEHPPHVEAHEESAPAVAVHEEVGEAVLAAAAPAAEEPKEEAAPVEEAAQAVHIDAVEAAPEAPVQAEHREEAAPVAEEHKEEAAHVEAVEAAPAGEEHKEAEPVHVEVAAPSDIVEEVVEAVHVAAQEVAPSQEQEHKDDAPAEATPVAPVEEVAAPEAAAPVEEQKESAEPAHDAPADTVEEAIEAVHVAAQEAAPSHDAPVEEVKVEEHKEEPATAGPVEGVEAAPAHEEHQEAAASVEEHKEEPVAPVEEAAQADHVEAVEAAPEVAAPSHEEEHKDDAPAEAAPVAPVEEQKEGEPAHDAPADVVEEVIEAVHVTATDSAPEEAHEHKEEVATEPAHHEESAPAVAVHEEVGEAVLAAEPAAEEHKEEAAPVEEAAQAVHIDAAPEASAQAEHHEEAAPSETAPVAEEHKEEAAQAVHVEAVEAAPEVAAPSHEEEHKDDAPAEAAPVEEHKDAAEPVHDVPADIVEEVIEAVQLAAQEAAPSHDAPVEEVKVEEHKEAEPVHEEAAPAGEEHKEAEPVHEEVAAPSDVVEEIVEAVHVAAQEAAPVADEHKEEAAQAEAPVEEPAQAVHVEAVEAAPESAAPSHEEEHKDDAPAKAAPVAPVEEVAVAYHVESVETAPEAEEHKEGEAVIESVHVAAQESSAPADVVEEVIEAIHVSDQEAARPESSEPTDLVHVSAEEAQQQQEASPIESGGEETFEKVEHSQVEGAPASEEPTSEPEIVEDVVEKQSVLAVAAAAAPETQQEPKKPRTIAEMSHESAFPVPYRSKLVEPFEPGQTLIVKGKTGEDSIRFTVNLHSNTADFSGNDVPLHVSVRFDEGKLVFNTFSKGEWGKEERKSNPYKKGDDIDIRIRAHDSKFQIFVDQKEVKEYEHRVPLSTITHFTIDGDVLVNYIHWGGKYYPVPYESGLAGEGLAPGKTLAVFGIPEKKAKRFHINLLKKNGDIALHLNARFDEKHVVRNSLINSAWGNEEREGKLPFEKAVGFDLEIHNEPYAFSISVNGERFASYAHRLSPDEINGLQIGGDVEITGIQIA